MIISIDTLCSPLNAESFHLSLIINIRCPRVELLSCLRSGNMGFSHYNNNGWLQEELKHMSTEHVTSPPPLSNGRGTQCCLSILKMAMSHVFVSYVHQCHIFNLRKDYMSHVTLLSSPPPIYPSPLSDVRLNKANLVLSI